MLFSLPVTSYLLLAVNIKATPDKNAGVAFKAYVSFATESAAGDEVAAEAFAAGIRAEQTHAGGTGTAAAAAGGTAVSAVVIVTGSPARALL